MAVAYRFRPGESINETKLARLLGGSRTPLREALNRLVAEGFIHFEHSRGFFGRDFSQREIEDLYELRDAIEQGSVRSACAHASDAALDEIGVFLRRSGPAHGAMTTAQLVGLDEHFHDALIAAGGNREMRRSLQNVNARIKFFRWIDMDGRRGGTQREHRAILAAVRARDAARGCQLMHEHIAMRQEQITGAIREGISRIYLDGGDDLLAGDENATP